jgi:hypothetical protein
MALDNAMAHFDTPWLFSLISIKLTALWPFFKGAF